MKTHPSLDVASHAASQRDLVWERYLQLLAEETSMPDKIFNSGYTIRDLDPNLVVLDEDAHEHPRVRLGSLVMAMTP